MVLIVYGREKNPTDGHADIAVYDPHRHTWIVIENTGRSAGQKLGAVFAYNNNRIAYNRFLHDCVQGKDGRNIPLLGISRAGIFAFDSLEKHFSTNDRGTKTLVSVTAKRAQPIPIDKGQPFYMLLSPVMTEARSAAPRLPAHEKNSAKQASTPGP